MGSFFTGASGLGSGWCPLASMMGCDSYDDKADELNVSGPKKSQILTGSGLPFSGVDSLVLSLRNGGGAESTCAAVGPECPLGSEPFDPGLRDGGVRDPFKTGKSSALGTRCFETGRLSTR